jgi:hypothetical protein
VAACHFPLQDPAPGADMEAASVTATGTVTA